MSENSSLRGRSVSVAGDNLQKLTPEPTPLSYKRRLSSFLHLHIPERHNSHAASVNHAATADFDDHSGLSTESKTFSFNGSVASQLHYLHLPTFGLNFGLGLRRHSNVTLHRSDSMASLCFRSFVTFINENNLQGFQAFLDNKSIQVDDRDENGTTALFYATEKGKIQFVRELLAHGADVQAEDSDGWSALACAAKEGHADICTLLLEHGAYIEHRDSGGWTSLMWAAYKGRTEAVNTLVEHGADVNAHGNYHVSSLVWAAGRGHTAIVQTLIAHGAKVNVGDKYGTSALIWACRKGNAEIVEHLLRAGANVDTTGMYSWTPLLVASMGNFVDVVTLLLEHKPNVNALDKDGCTALTIACKEGYHDIVVALLNAGAYINIQDRAGDTNLIHAVKGNHRSVVEALLKKYADVDTTGKDRKTAIYNAVEKGNFQIVKLLLSANADLEIPTKDGDTPLLRAVRIRNVEIVQLLLDKKAKVSAADRKGDTALHIAMRARSKAIVEMLLRNPKHSQLLYRPNRQGETPYNIDVGHQKTILGQIFGARRLNTNEDNENMLGYDLYSSALADILSEPSLSMPITVGLYAKWGSGKSFLLNKLREEMKNFAKQWVEPNFSFSVLLFVIIAHASLIIGAFFGILFQEWIIGLSTGLCFLALLYIGLTVIQYIGQKYDWDWPYNLNILLTRKLNSFKLILQVLFCHPPGSKSSDDLNAQPIRFYFTDQTRISSTTSGENSVVQMIGCLYEAIESDYGIIPTRLYRAFRPKAIKENSTWKWRKMCCLPYVAIFEISFLCVLTGACVLAIYLLNYSDPITLQIILITLSLPVGVAIIANLYTWARMSKALFFSQRRQLQKSIANLETLKSEGFLQILRSEVKLMTDMIKCLDSLTGQQTRLVIIVDGLDSCEQDKVLLVLDSVHMLFSDANSPFIVILAIDPHAISKAVEVNSKKLFSDSNIGGHDYLRNMVHLPFYLQNSGMRRVKVAQTTSMSHRRSCGAEEHGPGPSTLGRSVSSRRLSTESGLMSSCEKLKPPPPRKGSRKLKLSESIASSIGSNLNRIGGAHDLSKMLLTDDYFSDVNPRSMRRLMNVVYVTGRLLKAFQIDFNWYHLASWVNITEQWPFRTSWIILYHEIHEETVDDNTSLKSLYDKVRRCIPNAREEEPLLDLDRDERKFDIFLTFHRSSLLISDLKIFLPFTINLDPYIKKVIKEEQQSLDEDGLLNTSSVRPPYLTPAAPATNWASTSMPMWNSTGKSVLQKRPRTSGFNTPHNTSDMLYHHSPQPGVVGWSQPSWFTQTMSPKYHLYGHLPSITKLPDDILQTKLSKLSIDGVCELIIKMEDISKNMKMKYIEVIRDNNINGRVLLHCDLEDLKRISSMSFGDWELFRMLVVCLREQELMMINENESSSNKTPGFYGHSMSSNQCNTSSIPVSNNSTNRSSGDKMSSVQTDFGGATPVIATSNRSSTKPSNNIEKQVTMEDQMICGALQTLNEEACEDILENENNSSRESPIDNQSPSFPIESTEFPSISHFSDHTVVIMPPSIANATDTNSFSLLNTTNSYTDGKVRFASDLDQTKVTFNKFN